MIIVYWLTCAVFNDHFTIACICGFSMRPRVFLIVDLNVYCGTYPHSELAGVYF